MMINYIKNVIYEYKKPTLDIEKYSLDSKRKRIKHLFEKDYNSKEYQLFDLYDQEVNNKKQVCILVVGLYGVGKSSLIRYLVGADKMSKDQLNELNINEKGQGTQDLVIIESEKYLFYDYRGKYDKENAKQYIESLKSAFNAKLSTFSIDVIFCVLNAYNNRNSDIDLINEILLNLDDHPNSNSIEKTDFYVFLNKYDLADTDEKREVVYSRSQLCRNILKDIKCKDKRKIHKFDKPLLKTIYTVSCNPFLNQNDIYCNKDKMCQFLKQLVCDGNAVYCSNCQTLYISNDIDRHSFEYKNISSVSKTIKMVEKDYEFAKTTFNAIIKSSIKQKQINDFIISINECYAKIFYQIHSLVSFGSPIPFTKLINECFHNEYHELSIGCYRCFDKNIYNELSNQFGFENSKICLSKYESDRWERVPIVNYTIQWAIFPVTQLMRKFYHPGLSVLGAYAIYYSLIFKQLSDSIILNIIKKKSKIVPDASERGCEYDYSNQILFDEWFQMKLKEDIYIERILKLIKVTNLEYASREIGNQNIDITNDNFDNIIKSLSSSTSTTILKNIKSFMDNFSVPYKKVIY